MQFPTLNYQALCKLNIEIHKIHDFNMNFDFSNPLGSFKTTATANNNNQRKILRARRTATRR